MKLMRGRSPPGGWHFEVATGVKLTAVTEELLTKAIFEYRVRNNIPIGEISRDIDRYYCTRWPDACHKESSESAGYDNGVMPTVDEPIVNRITRWASLSLRRQPQGGHQLVSADEAQRRATICASCPKNTSWKGGCAGCSQTVLSILIQLRQLRKTSKDGNLNACVCGGWDNMTAVHMPVSELEIAPEQKASMPAACWRKAL